jgi:hypothetical protein
LSFYVDHGRLEHLLHPTLTIFAASPDLRDALAFALKYITDNRPSSPVRVCAEKLLEFSSRTRGEGSLGAEAAGPVDSGDADDEQAMLRTMARGRGRRQVGRCGSWLCLEWRFFEPPLSLELVQVVFSEPVKLDGAWTPVVVPKSEDDRAEIAAVLQRNILFAAMDDDQRRILIDAMVRKEFTAGTAIITQGDPGDFYYILTDGTCEILVNGNKVLQVSGAMGPPLLLLVPRSQTLAPLLPRPPPSSPTLPPSCIRTGRERHGFRRARPVVRLAARSNCHRNNRCHDLGDRPSELQACHDWHHHSQGE